MFASDAMPHDPLDNEHIGFSDENDPRAEDVGSIAMHTGQISELDEGELSSEELAEEAWAAVVPDFHDQFNTYWDVLKPEYEDDFPEADHGKQVAIDKEERFFKKVYAAARDMAIGHEGPITLLFDVDRTIRENNGWKNDAIEHLARPVFSLVIAKLIEDLDQEVQPIEVGLLTNISQAELDKQLQDPNKLEHPQYVACLPPGTLKPDFVISSRSLEKAITKWDELEVSPDENYAEKRALVGDILTDSIGEFTAEGEIMSTNAWYDAKLAILNRLLYLHPERHFVYVDDLLSANAIDQKHSRIRGVYVGPEVHNTTESRVAQDIINEQRF